MTLRHLHIFREAALTGNFTKAAANLYLTQSAVSHAIAELEREAGTLLFERQSKAIRLTRSGEYLLEEILPVLASCEKLEKKIKGLERVAPIHVVSSITIAIYHLPEIIRCFNQRFPETEIQTEVVSAAVAMERLHAGKADIALIEGIEPREPYQGNVFARCALKAICSPRHHAAGQILTASQFCREQLLLREKGSAVRDLLDSALYLQGCEVHPIWVSVNSTALLSAAKSGLGIAVLPEMLTESGLKEGTFSEVKIEGVELVNDMRTVWHKEKYMSAPLKYFIELATEKREGSAGGTDYFSY